jgi:hypothetical protein
MESLDEILEGLSPEDRDRYILAHMSEVLAAGSKETGELMNMDYDPETDILMDEGQIDLGVMNRKCCDNPEFVLDENCHDQICVNCGDANHCATLTIGRNLHFEAIATATFYTKAVYKRITHFRRILRDIQGGNVVVPKRILEDVRSHVLPPVTEKGVLLYLHEKRYMRYYSQSRFIAQCLGSTEESPALTSEQMISLTRLFLKYSEAFDEYKRSDEGAKYPRKNFLSYTFILHELCEELGYTELLQFIRPLKCKKTRVAQAYVWSQLPRFCHY